MSKSGLETSVANAIALGATAPVDHFTGVHFASFSDFDVLAAAGYQYVVKLIPPEIGGSPNIFGADEVLDAAEAAGIKVVIGLYAFGGPEPWSISGATDPDRRANGVWTFTANAISVIQHIATRSSLVYAWFGFNEPMWQNPFTGGTYTCGFFSAKNLRDYRTKVRTYFPGVKVWNDTGWASDWSPPSPANPTPELYNTYSCLQTEHTYDDWVGAMDYVGLYDYPFVNPSAPAYDKAAGIARVTMEIRFAAETMGATPALLMQSFGGVASEPTGPRYPTDTEIADWNCTIRSLFQSYPDMPLSWYVWDQGGFYDEELNQHQSQTPRTLASWC